MPANPLHGFTITFTGNYEAYTAELEYWGPQGGGFDLKTVTKNHYHGAV